ncbi:MAG: hypothetical protein R2766_05235 [Saprospiraceae bacterium]
MYQIIKYGYETSEIIVPCELFSCIESDRMDFLTASHTRRSINGGELHWNLGDLKPFEEKRNQVEF